MRGWKTACAAAILLLNPPSLQACGTCGYAIVWNGGFPSVVYWSVIGVAWYVALSLTVIGREERIRFVPHPVAAVPLVLVGTAFGVASAGPLTILLFLLAAGVGWTLSFNKRQIELWSRPFCRVIDTVSAVALLMLAVTWMLAHSEADKATPADIVAKGVGAVLSAIAVFLKPKGKRDVRLALQQDVPSVN